MMNKQRISLLCVVTSIFLLKNVTTLHSFSEPVDLSWYFENNTIYWTGVQPFIFTKIMAGIINDQFWLAMNEFCAGEHGGTHMDAPYHFYKNGSKIGQLPLKNFIVPGVIIDLSDEILTSGSDFLLQNKHIVKWEETHGPIPENGIVLIKFGWSQFYSDKKKYLGPNFEENKLSFPGLSSEAADFLTSKNIVGIGVDTASVDPGISTTFDAHQILTKHGLYLLENVKLLEELPVRDFTVIALPMNIAEGTGAPVRLIAVPKGYF